MAQLKSTIVNGVLSVTDTISEGGTLLSSKYVPQTRTVNGKALSSNISLSASDVSAVASNTAITGATKCKITYDSKGLVTSGANLAASDIPALNYAGLASGASSGGKAASAASADSVAWSGVTGKPTTISGFGITDAKIVNGTITIGSTSITPVTDVSGKTDKATLTTKGDMYYASAAKTPARLAVGSNGQFLSVASGVPTWVNNPNTNTTYTFASGTTKGSFQVTPSGGSASSVAIYGLGTAAYEDKTAFLAADGNAASATIATGTGDGSVIILGEYSDEVNFGGTGTNTSIYFGHRAEGSRGKPTDYYFGGSVASASAHANKFLSDAKSSSWYNGRDNSSFRQSTVSGYCPALSIKTTNGSWEIGTYDWSGFYDQLLFSYVSDSNYNSGTNAVSGRVVFTSDGKVYGAVFN